jgi:hypothetical protein
LCSRWWLCVDSQRIRGGRRSGLVTEVPLAVFLTDHEQSFRKAFDSIGVVVDATFELCFEHDYESRSVDPSVPLLVFFDCEGRDNSMAFGHGHAFSWLARRADVSRVFAVVVNDGERGDIRRRVSALVGPGHVLREVSDLLKLEWFKSQPASELAGLMPTSLVVTALAAALVMSVVAGRI